MLNTRQASLTFACDPLVRKRLQLGSQHLYSRTRNTRHPANRFPHPPSVPEQAHLRRTLRQTSPHHCSSRLFEPDASSCRVSRRRRSGQVPPRLSLSSIQSGSTHTQTVDTHCTHRHPTPHIYGRVECTRESIPHTHLQQQAVWP